MRRCLAAALLLRACAATTTCDASGADVMLVLDRSKSMGANTWEQLVPFARTLASTLATGATRVGLVVYPSESGDNRGDVSGNAKVLAPLEYSTSKIDGLSWGTSCKTNPKNSLKWPCSGWGFSPMWVALRKASEELYQSRPTARKVVIIMADGVPSKTKGGSGHFERAAYLTLKEAAEMKARSSPALILGVGVGSKFDLDFSDNSNAE